MDERKNAGYLITDSIHVGNMEFVMGRNERAPDRFVTWGCRNGDSYFWGHYFDDLLEAKADLPARANQELEHLEWQREMRKGSPNKVSAKKRDEGQER